MAAAFIPTRLIFIEKKGSGTDAWMSQYMKKKKEACWSNLLAPPPKEVSLNP